MISSATLELPVRRWVPDWLGVVSLFAVMLPVTMLNGSYTGSMLVPHFAGYIEKDRMEKTPDFMDLNLKLNYTFVLNDHLKLQLNGGVNNIFDAFQKDLDKGADRDSKYFYGPTQPRTLFIGVKIFN